MNKSNKQNLGLETLLELEGEIFPMDNGYWTKFEVKIVTPNEHIPHGIKYSLTLHNPYNKRILGYDNAHGIKPNKLLNLKLTQPVFCVFALLIFTQKTH